MEGRGDMAHLPAAAGGSGDNPPAADHAAADSGAHGEQHQVAAALASPLPQLAQGGQVGVVLHLHGHTRPAAQLLGHVHIPPAQVYAPPHQGLIQHRAGHPHPRADAHGVGEAVQHLPHIGGDVVKGGGQLPLGGELPLFQQVPLPAHQPQLDGGAADVDAKAYLSHGQTSSKFGPARRPADRASSHFMFQMFWAYSSTARSAEKKPALAMFTRDILLNRALSP